MIREPPRTDIPPETFAEIVGKASEVAREVPGLAAAWLHGSAARGEPAKDLDVAVLPREGEDPWKVANALAARLDHEVEAPVWWDVRPVADRVAPAFRFAVVRDGILLAEPDREARCAFQFRAARDFRDIAPWLRRASRRWLEAIARGA